MNKNIFYFGFISKPNDGIIVITLSLWKCHDFETILNSNDVMNIQDKIGNGFGYQERAYPMDVNAYFGPRSRGSTPRFWKKLNSLNG